MIESVDKDFIQGTTTYLQEVEEMLCTGTTSVKMHLYMASLSSRIQELMDKTCKAEDSDEKVILATLEIRARNCLDAIRHGLAVYG